MITGHTQWVYHEFNTGWKYIVLSRSDSGVFLGNEQVSPSVNIER